MNATLKNSFVLCLIAWLGGGAFLSFAVLPTLFSRLDTPVAGSVASSLFSIYDTTGLTAAVVLVASAGALTVRLGGLWKRALIMAAVLLFLQSYIALVLHPQVGELRGVAAERARFDSLHKRSVLLNSAALLGLIALTVTGVGALSRGDGRDPGDNI